MTLTASVVVERGEFELRAEVTVEPGQTLVVVGPNGAGKSTLLSAIAGTVEATGSARVDGRELLGRPIHERRVGYLFQDYLLFPHLSVVENVAFGPRARGMPRSAARARAREWLDRLGAAAFADRRPSSLSGGQAQRVALARALAAEPDVLLLDEPLAALDVEVRDEIRAELARHLAHWGGHAVVVSHDLADVRALASTVVVIEAGRVTQRGSTAELEAAPATAYARRLVASGAPADGG